MSEIQSDDETAEVGTGDEVATEVAAAVTVAVTVAVKVEMMLMVVMAGSILLFSK